METDKLTMADFMFWFMILSMVCRHGHLITKPSPWSLWPQPMFAEINDESIQIHPTLYRLYLEDAPKVTHSLLKKITKVSFQNLWAECGETIDIGDTHVIFNISIKFSEITFTWESSEKYTLHIAMKMNHVNETKLQVFIGADTVYGARHALETLTQLAIIQKSVDNVYCRINITTSATIKDEPAFKHRGLVFDTTKHYFRVSSIKRTLDGMAASKMNVFHWYITDTESFPLESDRDPDLTRYGALHSLQVYTKQVLEDIIEYAQIRGIIVMFEINGPASVYAGWTLRKDLNGKTGLECSKESYSDLFHNLNNTINKIIEDLYKDIVKYLPKQTLFHMGGNDVFKECWNQNYEAENLMDDDSFESYAHGVLQIWEQFYKESLKIWDREISAAGGRKKQPIILWSSDLTDPSYIERYLDPKRFVIELWDRESNAPELISLGYRVLVASSSSWFLNNQALTWRQVYSHVLTPDPNMLGGEVVMWTENIDESVSGQYYIDGCIWPRAAAFAERLWSNPVSSAPNGDTVSRLDHHRDRLMNRGLSLGALQQNLWVIPTQK